MKCFRIAALIALVAPAMLPAAANRLEGSWSITISFDGAPPQGFPPFFPVMHTFTPGGEVVESNSLPPAKGSGHGEWAAVGPWQFRYIFRFFVMDGTGTVIGYAQVKQWIQTDRDLTNINACRFIGDIFDFSGKQLLHSTGSCTGKRINVDLAEPAGTSIGAQP